MFLLISSAFIFVLVPMCVIVSSFPLTRVETLFLARAYLAELICARARPAHVRVECAWTALMSTFQLGEVFPLVLTRLADEVTVAASISVTVNGPPVYCHMECKLRLCERWSATHVGLMSAPWAMCASSFLLVCISWLAALISTSRSRTRLERTDRSH